MALDIETMLTKVRRSYRKNKPVLDGFRKGLYPDFVTSAKIETVKDHIPVFTYHFVEPQTFEAQLQFLSANEYRTIGHDEFYGVLTGEAPVPERTVLLTFDDGWRSLWTYAYPLLKKYGMQAVSFIVPGLVPEDGTYYPNLEDVWSGAVALEDLTERQKTDSPLCSWREIQTMSESGTLNFQSHTMYHSQVFVDTRVVDFYHPDFDSYPANLDIPNFHDSWTGSDMVREPVWGMPLYAYESRMAGKPRFYDNEQIRLACIEHVHKHGGAEFFKLSGWRQQLKHVVKEARSFASDGGHFESKEDLHQSIYQDLLDSKRAIEEKLRDHSVTHLCYPYFAGSDAAVELSKQAGYVANYWGFVEGRNSNRAGDDPFSVVRVDARFLLRLPGSGRQPLLRLLKQQLTEDGSRFFRQLLSV